MDSMYESCKRRVRDFSITSWFGRFVFDSRERLRQAITINTPSGAVAGRSLGSDTPTLTFAKETEPHRRCSPVLFYVVVTYAISSMGIVKAQWRPRSANPMFDLWVQKACRSMLPNRRISSGTLFGGLPKTASRREHVASWHGVSVGLVEGACTTSLCTSILEMEAMQTLESSCIKRAAYEDKRSTILHKVDTHSHQLIAKKPAIFPV